VRKALSEIRGRGHVVKLNEVQISRTLSQFKAQVLAEDDPAIEQLYEVFGHHTFFIDARGLYVLELLEVPGMETQDGEIIGIAEWSDASRSKLTTHQPEPTGLVIRLEEVRH
jgi:hypothetical protein